MENETLEKAKADHDLNDRLSKLKCMKDLGDKPRRRPWKHTQETSSLRDTVFARGILLNIVLTGAYTNIILMSLDTF
jgi:hypothetical protein